MAAAYLMLRRLAGPLAALLLGTVPVVGLRAQEATATLTVNLGGVASLSLSPASLSFPDADPDTFPLVPAAQGPLLVTAKARATRGSAVLLTVVATDEMRSGVNTLPAASLTWIGTGGGFQPGTVSSVLPQTVAAWVGSGTRTGTQEYRFANLWSHPAGIYTVTLLYTLTAP